MNLARLFVLHALVTFAAGIVLIAAPGLIPSFVGIRVNPPEYLLCYLLGAAEISLAVLSYYGRSLTDSNALATLCLVFIVLHVASAVVEILAFTQGLSATIWLNVAVRIAVVILLTHYGFYKKASKNTSV
jgi:hypothetical protein